EDSKESKESNKSQQYSFHDLTNEQRDTLKALLLNQVEEIQKVPTFGVFVSKYKRKPWGIVYIKNGDESKVLALNNTWPFDNGVDVKITQPMQVNIWNCLSGTRDLLDFNGIKLFHRQVTPTGQ